MSPSSPQASSVRVFVVIATTAPNIAISPRVRLNELRHDGVERVGSHQFEEQPDKGWPLWCVRQILDAKYVLLICNEPYRERFLGLQEFGKGRGVKWEAKVIQNILYYEEVNRASFLSFSNIRTSSCIPKTVRDASSYLIPASLGNTRPTQNSRRRLTGGKRFPPLGIPPRVEPYRQREDISVLTAEVWESSDRIEKKLNDLRDEQKRHERNPPNGIAP